MPWYKVIWQTVHADAATEHCLSPGAPDILLTDVSMEGVSGLQVTRDIRIVNGAIVILCMTSYTLETYAYGAAKAGAQGVCPKTPINLLCKGIEAVAQGRTWCPIENIPFESAEAAHMPATVSIASNVLPSVLVERQPSFNGNEVTLGAIMANINSLQNTPIVSASAGEAKDVKACISLISCSLIVAEER
ncbi:MAG: response regulator [Bifidobacterium sp.]|jgi:DNA-binding NarL/FixJ family response regulator|nr:response regulator [Bifidobacterium sp.]